MTDRRQNARQHDFDRPFGALIVVGRLFDRPQAAFGIANCQTGVRAVIQRRMPSFRAAATRAFANRFCTTFRR
jgi:hypothetical protein